FQLFLQLFHADVLPIFHFCRIWLGLLIRVAKIYVVQLMFCQTIVKFMFINKAELESQFAAHAHFLLQSSVDGIFHSFSLSWMAATSVGPKAGGVIFFIRTLLQKQFARRIENKYRKCPVQQSLFVDRGFFQSAYSLVVFIYYDQQIFHHPTIKHLRLTSPSPVYPESLI